MNQAADQPRIWSARVRYSGRPNPGVVRNSLAALSIGAHRDTAARWAGIEPATLRDWLTRAGEPYGAFRRTVEQAEAGFELRLVTTIIVSGDPALALALLERRSPERWARATAGPERDLTVTFDLVAAMLGRIHAEIDATKAAAKNC